VFALKQKKQTPQKNKALNEFMKSYARRITFLSPNIFRLHANGELPEYVDHVAVTAIDGSGKSQIVVSKGESFMFCGDFVNFDQMQTLLDQLENKDKKQLDFPFRFYYSKHLRSCPGLQIFDNLPTSVNMQLGKTEKTLNSAQKTVRRMANKFMLPFYA
jgi:hypothetical protein